MMLHPPKPDWDGFGQLGVLSSWPILERRVAMELGIVYVPWAEVTQRYSGLQCDGLHHSKRAESSEWGCHGFSAVTDVVTQLLLSRVLSGFA